MTSLPIDPTRTISVLDALVPRPSAPADNGPVGGNANGPSFSQHLQAASQASDPNSATNPYPATPQRPNNNPPAGNSPAGSSAADKPAAGKSHSKPNGPAHHAPAQSDNSKSDDHGKASKSGRDSAASASGTDDSKKTSDTQPKADAKAADATVGTADVTLVATPTAVTPTDTKPNADAKTTTSDAKLAAPADPATSTSKPSDTPNTTAKSDTVPVTTAATTTSNQAVLTDQVAKSSHVHGDTATSPATGGAKTAATSGTANVGTTAAVTPDAANAATQVVAAASKAVGDKSASASSAKPANSESTGTSPYQVDAHAAIANTNGPTVGSLLPPNVVAAVAAQLTATPAASKAAANVAPVAAAAESGATENSASSPPASNSSGNTFSAALAATSPLGSNANGGVSNAQGTTGAGGVAIDRVRFVQRVAQAFQTVGSQGGSLRLRLSPPDLGAVQLNVTVRDGVMNAQVQAETSQARDALINNLPELREKLADLDIKVDQFDVELFDNTSGDFSNQPRGQSDSQQAFVASGPRGNGNTTTSAVPAVDGTTVGSISIQAGSGGLNVLI